MIETPRSLVIAPNFLSRFPTHTHTHTLSPFIHVPVWGPNLAEPDAVTFLLYSQFHGSQSTKQPEIFKFSRADSIKFFIIGLEAKENITIFFLFEM